jgi:hypothetical protein
MSGFSTQLEKKEITGKLFRKVDGMNLKEGQLCTSTENSVSLISHGEFCLVYRDSKRDGLFFNGDADAGKNFGYDEFRTEVDFSDVLCVVFPDSWLDNSECDEWINNIDSALNISTDFLTESEYKQEYKSNLDFNF